MLFAAPAVASASPRWFINGTLAGATKRNVVAVGSLTMDNKMFGQWKCKVIAGLTVENETEKGSAQVEAWEPVDCSTSVCRGPTYVRAESPLELEERPSEKFFVKRGPRTVPWPSELLAPETGKVALNVASMKIFISCPVEMFEPEFIGHLEPRLVNGIGNGMSPSHVLFEGELGHNYLNGTWLGGLETLETKLFFSGELTILGTGEELITAR
jgi:hypothetical protein